MNKKILSLVLALVMVLGTFTTVFAEETKTEKVEKVVGKENKIQYVIDKKFVEGYGNGDYGYDKNIKRSEITKLLVFANGHKELSEKLQGTMKLYSDVDHEFWANGVISVGSTVPSTSNGQPMLNGYPDGSFQPEKDVTYAELSKMLVVLVKEDLTADMVKAANANWAAQWMTWAAQLGILDDVVVANSNAPATRADAFTMLYNALYKMVEFKRVPTNEKLGILSSLSKDKLVLNQDKEQTYTITNDTIFVLTYKEGYLRSNYVKVNDINDPDYYLGSLVRIMVNDKNEVTHILELGNPKEMAIGTGDKYYGDNSRWEGVADKTIETPFAPINTLDSSKEPATVLKGWAKIGFNGSKTSVKTITFQYADKAIAEKTLKINDSTKVFVANPYNNIMRQVKNIDEAMTLIGYSQAKWDMIPNVYAGYDSDSNSPALVGYANDKNTAKVLVFNVVTKDKSGERLRVIHNSSYAGDLTLENTDGELKDTNFIKNVSNFPYNYGDLYDVNEYRWASYNNYHEVIEKLIDHSDRELYPVVRVKSIKDNDNLVIEDRFGNESMIYVGDADIFNAKQYKDLRVGDFLQFRVDKGNEMDVVSILPRDNKDIRAAFESSHSIQKILKSVEKDTIVAKLLSVNGDSYPYTILVEGEYDIWESGFNLRTSTFNVTSTDVAALKAHVGESIRFNARLEGSNVPFAYNFRFNDGTGSLIPSVGPKTEADKIYEAYINNGYNTAYNAAVAEANAKIVNYTERQALIAKLDAYKALVKVADDQYNALDKKTITAASSAQDIAEAKAELAALKAANAKLVPSDVKTAYEKGITRFEKAIAEAEAGKSVTALQVEYNNYKAAIAALKVEATKDAVNNTVTEANVKAAVEKAVAGLTAPRGAATSVAVTLTGTPATATATVTITSSVSGISSPDSATVAVTLK